MLKRQDSCTDACQGGCLFTGSRMPCWIDKLLMKHQVPAACQRLFAVAEIDQCQSLHILPFMQYISLSKPNQLHLLKRQ